MVFTKGLKFKKFDLHIHTPASDDFKDKNVTAEDIVDSALEKGLTGIAITDHQTAEWVDKVVAKKKDLVIFPGCELLVTGGEKGIHVLVIFDVDKNTNHINQFLNKLGVYKKDGKKAIAAEVTVGQVADELEKYDSSAILILAHCHSSKGCTGDIKGETRTLIFEPRRKCLIGAEAKESDFLDKDKKKNHKRIIDCLDGTDSNYHKRKLGVYQSSDAHSLDEIGSIFTYFKVDEPITIEDIRQSLIDRDTRIRQSFEFKEVIYPRIDSLKITSGFLADQEFEFHEGLNSLLGAKGSGKSLAIEFLRFCLNQQPQNENIYNDHETKLEKCLKVHGEVKLKFMDDSGKEYLISREYNPAEDNPITIIDLSDNTQKRFQVEQVFPVLFLSQNEIIKIAEDKTGTSQRRFIDQFFDFYKHQQEIERLNKNLAEIDYKFADALKSHLASSDLQEKIATYKEEIAKLGRQIQNTAFDEYTKKEKIGYALQNQADFVDSLREMLLNTELEYKDITIPCFKDDEVNNNPAVKRTSDSVDRILKQSTENITKVIIFLDEQKKNIYQEIDDWKSNFEPTKKKYEAVVKQAGGTQIALDQKRKKLITSLSKLEKELTRYQGKAQQMKAVADKRDEIIKQLDEAHKAYFEERKGRCDYFTDNSSGALNITIKEREDKSAFKENLLKFKRGSWLKDDEIEIISDKITPRNFIDNLLRYEWSARSKREFLQNITDQTGIKLENIEKLAQHLLDEYEIKSILALLYTSVSKDVPSISYRVDSEFKKLNELSVGQKAIALLIIALSDGSFPIVIDQPEDSLDLRTIWSDVCEKLRGTKDERQFIFTTHNSSVAVASDTDKFTILQADSNHGTILYSGSINRPNIKKEIIDYLEGGKDTYDKKRQKYNF
ncbi:AAA family ATPase [Patescibacteria group bacterium]|nr:AAA family ATPase [Patescibacteria group bacterium]MBU4023015.1 AAA family ATPase [Patescibacteria group bacterium]